MSKAKPMDIGLAVVSSMSCLIVVYFQTEAQFSPLSCLHFYKASFKRTITRRPEANIFAFKVQTLFT